MTRSRMKKRNAPDVPALPFDILLHIFAMANMLERLTTVAAVCRSWRLAAADEAFVKTLDIAKCRSHLKPRTRKNRAQRQLDLAFIRGVNLGRHNLTTLVFDLLFEVAERHIQYASQRCPNLLNLVLPLTNNIEAAPLDQALGLWSNLESLHILYRSGIILSELFEMVGRRCPRLRTLKFSCPGGFLATHFEAIAGFMPNLKVLSLRFGQLFVVDPVQTFSSIEGLEQVYISLRVPPYSLAAKFSLTEETQLQMAVNSARREKGFPDLQAFHVCWRECSNLCMAFTMGELDP